MAPAPESKRAEALAALASGMSQVETARRLSINQSTVSRWAKQQAEGRSPPSPPSPPGTPPTVLPIPPVALPVPQSTIPAPLTPQEAGERLGLVHRRATALAPNTLKRWADAVDAGEIKPRPKDVLDLLEIAEKCEAKLPDRSKAALARDGVSAITILQKLRDAVERAAPRIQHAQAQETAARDTRALPDGQRAAGVDSPGPPGAGPPDLGAGA